MTMSMKYSARQKSLGLTECERICGMPWSELERLAHKSGWYGIPGDKVSVSLGIVVNMLVSLTATNHSIEPEAMAAWLPGLRNEALLELAGIMSNWSFFGPSEAEKQFWPIFYGDCDTIRSRIAPLLGCCSNTTTVKLRFFTPSDVQRIERSDLHKYSLARTPRFTVNAHEIAAKIQSCCGKGLFTATVANAE